MIIPFSPTRPDIDKQASLSSRATLNHPRPPAGGQQSGLEPLEPRLLLTGSFSAQFVPVDNSAALSGYNTYDLQVSADVDWRGASLLIELTQGSIYQDPAGTNRASNPVLFNTFPGLEFDTYVADNGSPSIIMGRASDVGGDVFQFDTTGIDISWGNVTTDDIGTEIIGRVTLSDDAAGNLGLSVRGENPFDRFATWDTFTTGDLVNLTPAAPRPKSPSLPPPPPTGSVEFGVRFVQVDNSEVLSGYKTFDLQVSTDTDWTVAAMLIELTRGSIYQDPAGSDLAPASGAVDFFPTLEFDSYVTGNGHSTSIVGAAGDLGGNKLQFDTTEIDVTWSNSALDDLGTIVIGRVTISDDAAGIVRVAVAQAGNPKSLISSEALTDGNLITGESFVPLPPAPEPITAEFVEIGSASVPPGFKTYDLRVTTEADWMNASLLVDLTEGSIYQDPAGSDLAPNPVAITAFPSLEFDTYLAGSGRLTSIAGDADGVDGGGFTFGSKQIDISWTGPGDDDTGTFSIGQVTISEDAIGELKLVVAGRRSDPFVDELTFTQGNLSKTATVTAEGDFTGDGMADILWRDTQTGLSSVWQMNRTTFMSDIGLNLQIAKDWRAVGTGDLTGDGKTDILWRNTRNGRNMVTEMDGTDVLANTDIKRLRSKAWVVGGIGDFTGDGKADILWRNTRNGRNSVWQMDGTTFQDGIAIKTVKSTDWNIAGVSDFTGDGKADILWRNTRNGRNSVWEMAGTAFQSNTAVKQVKSQRWQVAGVGDYTGDGLADILWRDTKKGKNRVWEMKGTNLRSNIFIQSQANRNLQPSGTLLGLWE